MKKMEMYHNILNLILSYLKEEKEVDRPFLVSLTDIISSYYNIADYVLNVKLIHCNPESDSFCDYDFVYKIIEIDLENSLKYFKEEIDSLKYTEFELKLYKYFYFVDHILHECIHAYQNKVISEELDTNLTNHLLLTYDKYFDLRCLKLRSIDKNSEDYKKVNHDTNLIYYTSSYYYDIDLIERLAYLNSYQNIVNMLRTLPNYVPNLLAHYLYNLHFELFHAYKVAPAPTQYFFQKLGAELDEDTKKESRSLPLKEKLSLGLPLSKKDYIRIRRLAKKF